MDLAPEVARPAQALAEPTPCPEAIQHPAAAPETPAEQATAATTTTLVTRTQVGISQRKTVLKEDGRPAMNYPRVINLAPAAHPKTQLPKAPRAVKVVVWTTPKTAAPRRNYAVH